MQLHTYTANHEKVSLISVNMCHRVCGKWKDIGKAKYDNYIPLTKQTVI